MSRSRPELSIALPPSFAFPRGNAALSTVPQTPDQGLEEAPMVEPPPPPRQKYTIKRRRAAEIPHEPMILPEMEDSVIPTIEMSESLSASSSPVLQPSRSAIHGLLSPLPVFSRLITPKTPCARRMSLDGADLTPSNEWDLINDSRMSSRLPFQRSNSVCSSFSDSSVSSGGSSGAFSAPTGHCTSPESVATDPFLEEEAGKIDTLILSPTQRSSTPIAKRVKRHRQIKWTPEMDQHLENTYIRYLSDPRVTPFKTLPGVPPPLGVCNRVSVRARQTWTQCRAATPSALDTIMESSARSARQGSPDTIRPDTSSKDRRQQPQWPRSDAATRKRLRKLVKGKPALSAHYQRLLRTRSPSPFASTSSANRSSEPPPLSSAFSSMDMKLSLITSTAPSMQPEGPLAQLANEESEIDQQADEPPSQRDSRPADWFARIGRSQAHQKSLSLQSELDIESDLAENTFLASPFDTASNRSHLLNSMSTTKSLGRTEFSNKNGKRPSLDAPFELELMGAPTMPRSLKRRFKSDEEKPRRPILADVFSQSADDVGGIVRNRGFSVGTTRAMDNLAKLFDPPLDASSPDHEMTEASLAPTVSDMGPIGSRSVPRRLAEPIPRLGSPFSMETPGAGRHFNTFPRNYVPTPNNPQPFHQRLRELAAQRKQEPSG